MSVFDKNKGLEVLVYIFQSIDNMYKALKVAFFADKLHLSRYGRTICGDRYIAMENGPVPSTLYNLIKKVRGDELYDYGSDFEDQLNRSFEFVAKNTITPLRSPDVDLLSNSDIECLDEAISRIKHLSFSQIKKLSHSMLSGDIEENGDIQIENIIGDIPDKQEILDYINN